MNGTVSPSSGFQVAFFSNWEYSTQGFFVEYKTCRLSDWLAILASQSESPHFFVLYDQVWVDNESWIIVHAVCNMRETSS